MENSTSYIAVEAMLEQGWLTMSFSELETFLEKLRKKRLITASEQKALLELARKLNVKK